MEGYKRQSSVASSRPSLHHQLSRLDSCVSGASSSDLPEVTVVTKRDLMDKCSSFISAGTTESLLVTEDEDSSQVAAAAATAAAAAKKRRRRGMRRLSSPTLASRR